MKNSDTGYRKQGREKEKMDMPTILFPHTYAPESLIRKIAAFFGSVKIFQPWYMEPPEYARSPDGAGLSDANADEGRILVVNPPENLKPGGSFLSLVNEYRLWMGQNRDKSYREIIKSGNDSELHDSATWEIRKLLRNTVRTISGEEEDNILRWHLLLHFAKELETQQVEVDSLLKNLKDKDSLLKGSIERADEAKNILEDLPPFDQESFSDDKKLEQIFDAWFGLFVGYLKENELFITYNRHVMENISRRWDNRLFTNGLKKSPPVPMMFPDLSHLSPAEQDRIKTKYRVNEIFKEIKVLISDLYKDPGHKLKALTGLTKDFNDTFSWDLSGRTLRLSLKYLQPAQDKEFPEGEMVFRHLANKILIQAGD